MKYGSSKRSAARSYLVARRRYRSGNVANFNRYKRSRRLKGNIRLALYWLFFAACFGVGYYLSLLSFFDVKTVEILGNDIVSDERIFSISGIKMGDNIFTVSKPRTRQLVAIDYRIASVEVEKIYPSTVIITVSERIPAALVPFSGGFLEIDTGGVVLQRIRTLSELTLPILSGVTGFNPGIVPGIKIDGNAVALGLEILAECPAEGIGLTELNVSKLQDIVFYTKSNTEVRVGDGSDFLAKYSLANTILSEEERKGTLNVVQYLDVSISDKSPVILYDE